MKKSIAAAAILAATVAGLSACSKDGEATSDKTKASTSAESEKSAAETRETKADGGRDAEACELLTEDIAKSAIGDDASNESSGGEECLYTAGIGNTVMLTVMDAEVFRMTPSREKVDGVGDDAFIGPVGGLYVRKGDDAFMVMVTNLAKALDGADSGNPMAGVDDLETEKAVANKILENF